MWLTFMMMRSPLIGEADKSFVSKLHEDLLPSLPLSVTDHLYCIGIHDPDEKSIRIKRTLIGLPQKTTQI